MASTVGAGVPDDVPLSGLRSIPVGLTLPPDASSSYKRGDSADASLSPLYAGWGVQNGITGPISGGFQGPIHPQISYETGLMCRLTGQAAKWEAVLK